MVELLKQRADDREHSANLLKNLLHVSRSHPVTGVVQNSNLQGHGRSGWWAWLERLENELLEEQVRTLKQILAHTTPVTDL